MACLGRTRFECSRRRDALAEVFAQTRRKPCRARFGHRASVFRPFVMASRGLQPGASHHFSSDRRGDLVATLVTGPLAFSRTRRCADASGSCSHAGGSRRAKVARDAKRSRHLFASSRSVGGEGIEGEGASNLPSQASSEDVNSGSDCTYEETACVFYFAPFRPVAGRTCTCMPLWRA